VRRERRGAGFVIDGVPAIPGKRKVSRLRSASPHFARDDRLIGFTSLGRNRYFSFRKEPSKESMRRAVIPRQCYEGYRRSSEDLFRVEICWYSDLRVVLTNYSQLDGLAWGAAPLFCLRSGESVAVRCLGRNSDCDEHK